MHLIPNYTIELIPLKIKNNPTFTPSPLERVGVRIIIPFENKEQSNFSSLSRFLSGLEPSDSYRKG
jgi:hypothetical protein